MTTVYVLGAGASVGSSPVAPRTQFPAAKEIMQAIRKNVCQQRAQALVALACFLRRFAPIRGIARDCEMLHEAWDETDVEELYAAIEFESRLSDHLTHKGAYERYFPEDYQARVTSILKGYGDWVKARYFTPAGDWSDTRCDPETDAFPYRHENFLRLVREQLLECTAQTLGRLSETEDTSNLARLATTFRRGDVIVTFNYDLLLESHLRKQRPNDWFYSSGYGGLGVAARLEGSGYIGEQPRGDSHLAVIKPHGSCNWHLRIPRKGAKRVPEEVGPGYWIPSLEPDGLLLTDSYRAVTSTDSNFRGFFTRLMIPPSTYKAEFQFVGQFLHGPGDPIPYRSGTAWVPQAIFFSALRSLSSAERIVFIGYSVPSADTSMRMLLRSAADLASSKQVVELVDPCEEVEERIRRVYPNADLRRRHESFTAYLDSIGA